MTPDGIERSKKVRRDALPSTGESDAGECATSLAATDLRSAAQAADRHSTERSKRVRRDALPSTGGEGDAGECATSLAVTDLRSASQAADRHSTARATDVQFAVATQVRFDVEKAQYHLVHREWDLLESYLSEFLRDAHGENVQSHPRLLYTLYEAFISDLIDEGQVDDAMNIFKNKVAPLSQDKDSLYRPIDLVLTLPGAKQNINDAVVSYIQLYFPESLSHASVNIFGKDTVHCFMRAFQDDEKVTQYSCLACGWPISLTNSPLSISHHIKHSNDCKRCPSVTKWMLKRLASIERSQELDIDVLANHYMQHLFLPKTTQSSVPSMSSESQQTPHSATSKKPPPLTYNPLSKHLSDVSVLVDPKHGLEVMALIQITNLKIVTSTSSLGTATACKVCLSQSKPISAFVDAFCDARMKGHLMNGHAVFLNLDSLLAAHRDVSFFLEDTPDDLSELILEKDRLITQLRYDYFEAVAKAKRGN